jgi:signal transduction histidine kinase/ligand-binding sensor domain-containing protein/DNA-binding response OmpR family regulator
MKGLYRENMKRLYWLLIVYFITPFIHAAYFKHIGMKEGLSQLCVMSIYQDDFGRMWFGTEEGLCVYNGNQVISYKPSDFIEKQHYTNTGLLGNTNFPVTGDGKGSLFFVSDNKLLRFDLRSEQFETLLSADIGTVAFYSGCIWVGINDSVVIWDNSKKCTQHLLTIKNARIQQLLVDTRDNSWIGTLKGLYCHSPSGKLELVIPDEDIYTLFEDSKRNLWVGTRENGMYLINDKREIQKFTHRKEDANSLSSNHIRCFVEDNSGNLLIGTFSGLNSYDPEKKKFSVYTNNLPGGLLRSSVFSILKDRQGTIWIGTYYGGVHYFNPEMDIFTYYSANIERNDCLSDPFVGKMTEDNNGNIWICTEGGGLNFFDRKTKKITHYLSSKESNSIAHNNLKGICFSPSREKLYIGTHTGGLSIFDIKKNSFHNIPLIKDETGAFVSDVVNHVVLVNDQYLILLTRSGVFKMSPETYRITTLFEDGRNFISTAFHIDVKNNIWLIQGEYITRINLLDASDKTSYHRKDYNLGRFPIISVFEDREGRIFFGTRGSGLYMLSPGSGQFVHFTAEQNLLQSNYCYEIAQSSEGYLIITGDKGLSLLDPDKRILRSVELELALPLSGLNYGCGILTCRNGEVFVGGVNGLATYFEQDLHLAPKEYQLYFSSLWVNNEEVVPNAPDGIIDKALPYMDHIRLKSYQNNLRFSFTSNNYIETITETGREYRLSGFDDKWLACYENSISYTNLNPGKYTLYVRETHPAIPQETNCISMDIEILAPVYATTGAYVLYACLVLGGLYLFFRIKQTRLLLSASLAYERKEKVRIEELNKEKLQFFSNISHEFRTPLTLIISQIELLMQNRKLAPVVYNRLVKIYKHSFQMRTLITELLDFRKLEQGYNKLHISERDLVSFVREIYLLFTEMAVKEKINYTFTSSSDTIICWFDAGQMQKVILNLLSNAFKFTKSQGFIEVSIEETDSEIRLEIIDNGVGIEKSELQHIFDRFYQGTNEPAKDKSTIGSGLGLALARTIVALHQGEISVESKPGYGSIFLVKLLKGKDHFKREDIVKTTYIIDENPVPAGQTPEFNEREEEETPPPDGHQERYTILIVEDNGELLQLLSSLFAPYCKVIPASNGREGLNLAHKEMPDIILSDVMMPEMSGTEMCSRIKNDRELCHIPVVLLTALNSPDQSIEGLSLGAEAYISKPFDSRVLVARCNSIIRNRMLLHNSPSHREAIDDTVVTIHPADRKFLESIQKLIPEKLSDETFDINQMAKQMGLSRSSFYAKFKTLTGMSPNDFVLDYKLKQSAIFLEKNPDMQISEIAINLGFGSARYFSRCFKARYGISPAEYRAKNH